MLLRNIHIVFLFLLGFQVFAQDQTPNWTVDFSETRTFMKIPSGTLTSNGKLTENGDFIGVFTLKNDKEICLGFTEWSNNTTFIGINYFKDNPTIKAALGDPIYFKHWDHIRRCTYIESKSSPDQLAISEELILIEAIESSDTDSPVILNDEYFIHETEVIQNINPELQITFFASSDSLNIDQNTGSIFPSQSFLGEYEVYISSDICYSQVSYAVKISEEYNELIFSPSSSNPEFRQVLIEEDNTIEIFDKTGRLIMKLDGPAFWNGRDSQGNLVASDDYFMKAGNVTKVMTVIQ